ncbi:MAG: hypothetical protein E7623_00540 [Ruminococcaceae bacterium]|nr:hypothetical protein [Oscillospiraceae bacterium]
MEIDKNELLKLQAMNEEEFKTMVKNIANRLDLSPRYVDMITKNSEKVKRKMGNLSATELNKLASGMGEDKLKTIMEEIKRR